MNSYFCTHSGHDSLASSAIKRNHDRNTLSDFGKVSARGVLIGQERKLTSSGLYDLYHMAGEAGIAIRIDMDVNGLTNAYIIDRVLIHICSHIHSTKVCHRHERQPRSDVLALYRGHLQNGAVYRTGQV